MRIATALAFCVGCAEVPQPFELDHARVMAVRVEPPAIAAGEVARVDVLVTDPEAGPRVAAPDDIAIAPIAGVEIASDGRGWYVVGPPVTASVIAALSLTVQSSEGPLPAQKTLAFGKRADNPPVPEITVDGRATDETIAITGVRDRVLSIDATADDLSYRWFSSIGELVGYTRASATLEPTVGDGYIAIVVRDQAGGTAWTLAPATVMP